MKIFDNIGCEFSYNFNDNSFVLLSALPGHKSLPLDSAGNTIPYLARNINNKDIDYELGVGYLEVVNNKLILKDKKISLSSNQNNSVNFTKPGNKQFYIFVHSVNFDNAFNNIFLHKNNFNAEASKSVYIVDVSSGYIICNLPNPSLSEGVELEFKSIGDSGSLTLKYNDQIVGSLSGNSYTKLVSTGIEWVVLQNVNDTQSFNVLSSNDQTFNSLSNPVGVDRSFQYKDDQEFGQGSIYEGNNHKILFGSDDENLAKHIIPSSGSHDLVINSTKDGSNFIVYGTGNAPGYPTKNLYFSFDGRLGINMPSGISTSGIIKPSTVLHVFNTLCREGIRLENRASCYPADITLYDNPFTLRSDNDTFARVVFAGKDSSSNKVDYARIEAKATSVSSKVGQINFILQDGSVQRTGLSIGPNSSYIATTAASLNLNNNSVVISGSNLNINANTSIQGTSFNVNAPTSFQTGVKLNYITPSISNPLLALSPDNTIVEATEIKLSNISGASQGNLLSTTSNGSIVATLSKDAFWPYELGEKIGGKDFIWDRYPFVSASACEGKDTQELDLLADASLFSIGDQLALFNLFDGTTQYRTISSMSFSEDQSSIIRINTDSDINFPSGSNLRLYSVSKGGILTNTLFTSGIVSDATSNIFSTRPNTDTIFNTLGKDIDFLVYGQSSEPVFKLDASKTGVIINNTGVFEYQRATPFISGSGLAASLSVGGYIYTDAIKITDEYIQNGPESYSSVINISGAVLAVSGTTIFANADSSEDEEDRLINLTVIRPDSTFFTKPIVVTTGNSTNLGNGGGVRISATGIDFVSNNGTIIEGGLFPGPTGFFSYKNSENLITTINSKLGAVQTEEGFYPTILDTDPNTIIHNNEVGYLTSSSWFAVNDPNLIDMDVTSRGNQYVSIRPTGTAEENELPPLLYTSRIFIGPSLEAFSGSLLTHNGTKAAYWQPDNFLKAPGAVWNRYPRRAIELISSDTIQFIDLDVSKGGTGPVSVDNIKEEFAINETIAIYNQNREVFYVKVKGSFLIDSRGIEGEPSFFKDGNEASLTISFCPSLSEEFIDGLPLILTEDDIDNGREIGYAFSIQKGAYLDMEIEPGATQRFACSGDASNSEYRFKPSTFNTISIRPSVFTVFNKIAEDIDFVVYGHRKTLFTRYEPEWFDQDVHGVPTGLTPAFRVHSKIDNSYLGSISNGVFRNTVGLDNVATGVVPDTNPKTTINTNIPYKIASITGIRDGVLLPGASSQETLELEKNFGVVIPATGTLLRGINDISYYADLTVSGVTYSDALITQDIVIGPLWTGEVPVPYELSLTQKVYAPNYPLTINQLGQIVSMIPPPSPEEPTKPLAVTGVAKNSAIELSWTIPEKDGGVPILGYVLQYSTDDGNNWNNYDQIDLASNLPVINNADNGRVLISGIFNNTGFQFRTRAYNSIGPGEFSDPSNEITPTSGILRSPSNFAISGVRPNITLSWNSVTSGNIEFLEYIIEERDFILGDRNLIDPANWTTIKTITDINTTSTIIEGLSLEPLYYFSIQAKGRNNGIISLSNRAIITSIGTDPSPIDIVPEPPPPTDNPYNFGKMIFTGNCNN